ncbi:MAG: transposase [Halobacteriota archaeon]|nr:transposase [Halobacteriota archaeon]
MSNHNIPFQSITYPANDPDLKIFLDLIDDICKRLEEIEISLKDVVIIFDRGMNSTKNIGKVMVRMHVVGSLPASMCKSLFRIPVSEFDESWENTSGNIIKAKHVCENWYENDFFGAIKYNDATRRKQMTDWNQNKEKIFAKIDDIRSKLNRKGKGRKMTAKSLINRVVDAIPKQYRGLFDYVASMNDGVLKLDFKLNTARETEYIAAIRKTVVFTDIADLTPRQIVETYDARSQIETDIKWLKNRMLIPLMPEHVWKDVKIRAHVFLCVVGMLLYNYLLYLVDDPDLSMELLASHLDQMRLGLVYNGGENAREHRKAEFVIEDMNKETAEVFFRLQLGKYIPE